MTRRDVASVLAVRSNPREAPVPGPHLTTLATALLLVACLGGCGGDDSAEAPGSTPSETATEPEASGPAEGEVRTGDPTLTADPGTAWAEVDGSRLEYSSAGSINHVCDLAEDRAQVNFQTADGRDLLLQLTRQEDAWLGRLTFQPGGGENLQYSADLPAGASPMILGEDSLSFEGTVSRIEEFDVAGATEVAASVAVSCAPTGDEPNAVVDGTTYLFPTSGAQSVTCVVADDAVDVRVNRLAVDELQLEVSALLDGEQWVGAVVVYAPEGTFTSPVPADGSGLEISGSTVEYTGTFTGGEADVSGTVSVTCP